MYYFRWYALKSTSYKPPITATSLPSGCTKPDLPDFGALPDAAPFHLGEARWLRDPHIAEDYARFWYLAQLPDSAQVQLRPRPPASATCTLATGDTNFGTSLLPELIAQLRGWEATQQDPQRPLLVDRHPRRHGEIHQRRRLPPHTQQLHGRRRARHRGYCARCGNNRQSPPTSPPKPTPRTPHRNQALEPARPVLRSRLARQPTPASAKRRDSSTPAPPCNSPACASSSATSPGATHAPATATPSHGSSSSIPQGFDGKYRPHHRRAPQPALPLRLLRSMHLERPAVALRDDANPTRARQPTSTTPRSPHTIDSLRRYDKLFSRYVLSQHFIVRRRRQHPCPHRHRLDRRRPRRRHRRVDRQRHAARQEQTSRPRQLLQPLRLCRSAHHRPHRPAPARRQPIVIHPLAARRSVDLLRHRRPALPRPSSDDRLRPHRHPLPPRPRPHAARRRQHNRTSRHPRPARSRPARHRTMLETDMSVGRDTGCLSS